MVLRIEKVQPHHLEQICAIENESFSDPWSMEAFLSVLDDPLMKFISAFEDNSSEPVGFALMRVFLDEAEILDVAVDVEYRRCGIGREMMVYLLDCARNEGVLNLYLEVRESNIAARGLYEALGFRPVGRRRKYYTKPTEDAIVMCASLYGDTVGD